METENFSAPKGIPMNVHFDLLDDFKALLNEKTGCAPNKIIVPHGQGAKTVQCWVECPEDVKDLVCDLAAKTWEEDPEKQTHYKDSPHFQNIAQAFLERKEAKKA